MMLLTPASILTWRESGLNSATQYNPWFGVAKLNEGGGNLGESIVY
jgi:hypothetical protein